MSDALQPLYAVSSSLQVIEEQRKAYNSLISRGFSDEARQQIKSISIQLQSIMSAYNTVVGNLNSAENELPDELLGFM